MASIRAQEVLGTSPSAERRQVTALSYDLVGSTQLLARFDPEDVRNLQHSFHEVCARTVSEFGGRVDNYAGDGAMVIFGCPQAHENASERAVRAGLTIVAQCEQLNRTRSLHGIEFAVRVGIASGVVVAGTDASIRADVVGMS